MSFSNYAKGPNFQSSHCYSVYFAPRGRDRFFALGMQIAQLYLTPFDKVIGIIGESGSGKSMIVKGMFPGLELTNDDEGVNVRPLPLLEIENESGFFTQHTYHVDIRFELGFTQMHVLADAIVTAVNKGKRVIVEHFDLIYPHLPFNAHLMVGVGEEVLITRPNVFGPKPKDVHDKVYRSIQYRLMAHSAEDLCLSLLSQSDLTRFRHDDIKHGFVIVFPNHKPDIDISEMEKKVNEIIEKDVEICYSDDNHIMIGDYCHPCTGPRAHVSSSGLIKGFRLVPEFIHNSLTDEYLLVGRVGERSDEELLSSSEMTL